MRRLQVGDGVRQVRSGLDRDAVIGLKGVRTLRRCAVVDRLITVNTSGVDRATALEELALDLTRAVTVAEIAHAQRSDDRVDDNLGIRHDVVERLGRGRQ